MAKNQRYTHGNYISVTATKDVASGDAVKVGQIVGVAQIDAKTGDKVTVWLKGSYLLPVTGVTSEGSLVYIKESDNSLSTTAAGSFPFGFALAAKTSALADVEVVPFGSITAATAGA